MKWDHAHSEFETIRSISNLNMSFIRDHWKQRVRNENLLECIVPYARVDAKAKVEKVNWHHLIQHRARFKLRKR